MDSRAAILVQRPVTRRTAPATALLAVALLAIFGVELAGGVEPTCLAWGLDPATPTLGRTLASLFLHAGWGHLLGNVAVLVAAGPLVERAVGSLRLLALFLLSGLAGVSLHALVGGDVLVGASPALCGLLAVAATIRPRVWLVFVVAFLGVNLLQLLDGSAGEVSVVSHIGGAFAGCVYAVVARLSGPVHAPRPALA